MVPYGAGCQPARCSPFDGTSSGAWTHGLMFAAQHPALKSRTDKLSVRNARRLERFAKQRGSDLEPGMTVRQAPALWGCSRSTAAKRINQGECPAG